MRDYENKTAAYLRLSRDDEDKQESDSIRNQRDLIREYVSKNKGLHLVNEYVDDGYSGTSYDRPSFQRLLDDIKHGKVNTIIVKDLSRLGRNYIETGRYPDIFHGKVYCGKCGRRMSHLRKRATYNNGVARDISDCIKYITKLKTMNPRHPVGVYFETENLYTLDPNSDQVLHFHALLAHWESANKSRRMILSYDQRICTGQYPVLDLLGYRHTKDGKLIIQEDEAKTVQYVFLSLAAGKSCERIATDLTKMRRKTLKGKTDWNGRMVRSLTQNERRWGDLEARKTIVIDPREKIIVKNNGIRDWAFVPGHHKGIISPELAKAARFMSSSRGKMHAGVPTLTVIRTGALKGFVSVHPRWNGMDQKTLLSACEAAYSEEGLKDLKKDIEIWSGREQSIVRSMALSGYEVPWGIQFLTTAMPMLTISCKSIRFSKACYRKLNCCEWIEILYHPLTQTVALRESSPANSNAVRWVTETGNLSQKIESKVFSQAVYESLKWIPTYRFRFRGITKERGGERILFFSLDEPQILVGKGKRFAEAGNQQAKYIPYTTDRTAAKLEDGVIAFPEEWRNRSGVHCLLRKKREGVISSITADDIQMIGEETDNPLIGSIPRREQILQELDELVLSM